MSYGTISLMVENEIVYADKSSTVLGVAGGQDGWYWDRRLLSDAAVARTQWLGGFGPVETGLLDGTAVEDWTSGVVSGLDLHSVLNWNPDGVMSWTPVYDIGDYALHWDTRRMFSDFSGSQVVDPTNLSVDSLVRVELPEGTLFNTVAVRTYLRDQLGRRFTAKQWVFVENFTGELVGDERVNVGDIGSWNTANFSTRHLEITLDEAGDLVFNQSPVVSVGAETAGLDADVIRNTWEFLGTGNPDGRFLLLKYFPIDFETLELVAVDPTDVVQAYDPVRQLWSSESTDYDVAVDADLGILDVGGFAAPDLVLAENVDNVVTTIPVLASDEEWASWPDGGILLIGSEEIVYRGKGRRSFLNCTRAAPVAHTAFVEISQVSTGAGAESDWDLYVRYKAVPRVDYELTECGTRTANGSWLNVHPVTNRAPNRIVQVAAVDQNLASIVLTVGAPLIGGSVYGPVYYGTDIVNVTATAYDALGRLVDDIELTIEILEGAGSLNNSGSTYTNTTGVDGDISCVYNSPYRREDIVMPATVVTYDGGDTELLVPTLMGNANPQRLWLFQVLKHDPTAGTTGKEVGRDTFTVAAGPAGSVSRFRLKMEHTENYGSGSQIVVFGTDSVIRRYNILAQAEGFTGTDEAMLYFTDSTTSPHFGGGARVWLLGPEDIDTTSTNGTYVILYRWFTSGYTHPLTGLAASVEAPVAAPLHPSSVVGTTIRVPGVELPQPSTTARTNNLSRYVVIGPTQVRLRATGVDPYSGRLIESNIVTLQLDLPGPLVGVDSSGVLPVPHGWRLPSEEFNTGGGMGGANFLTINPVAAGINRFTLRGST